MTPALHGRTLGSSAGRLLQAGWPGTRVTKTAVATGVSWWVATLLGDPAPMFAVFGALNGMQSTVTASLRRTGGALVGILLGTLLAVVSEAVVGAPKPLMVALLVGLGLLVTIRLNAYSLVGTEVVVTGVLVFALSQGNALWSLSRFGETALGGGIAVVLNVLVLPPDYRQDARRSIGMLAAVRLTNNNEPATTFDRVVIEARQRVVRLGPMSLGALHELLA